MTLVEPPWHAARAAAHVAGTRLPDEQVPLADALHRFVGAPVRALTPLPPHPSSAMDGWAVAGFGPWRVVGRVLAGQRHPSPLAEGGAVAVATGTALPDGATAVLRREHGEVDADGTLHGTVTVGQDVRPVGEECEAGEVLVDARSVLTPIRLGLVAAAGHDTVTVVRRPRARVLVLGDELLTDGPARDGSVRDSLGVQVPAWLRAWGCDVIGMDRVADTDDPHAAIAALMTLALPLLQSLNGLPLRAHRIRDAARVGRSRWPGRRHRAGGCR